jgi:hypothetical protein
LTEPLNLLLALPPGLLEGALSLLRQGQNVRLLAPHGDLEVDVSRSLGVERLQARGEAVVDESDLRLYEIEVALFDLAETGALAGEQGLPLAKDVTRIWGDQIRKL